MIKKSSLTKEFYKPRDVVALLGVSLPTVQNMTRDGRLIALRSETNRRLITRDSLIAHLQKIGVLQEDDTRFDAVYARVSTHKQKERGDLERQVEKVTLFSATCTPKNLTVFTDVASGLNDNRKGLLSLLNLIQQGSVDRVFVLYKDRLTRFGFNYLKAICDFHHTSIVVVSEEVQDKSLSEELAEDIISIIHSFSGKMYGLRRHIKQNIKDD